MRDLDDAAPEQRVVLIRDAVSRVADRADEYLDSDEGEQAIAASQLPGGAWRSRR